MKPLVYIDACCFGLAAHQTTESLRMALLELRLLVFSIDQGYFRFVDSAWLRTELQSAGPPSACRSFMALFPGRVDASVPNRPEARQHARQLSVAMDLSQADSLHLSSALAAKAHFLVTMDKELIEKSRQHATLLRGLRVIALVGSVPEIYRWRPRSV